MGNGKNILFWKDKWLENYGPLITLLNPEEQVDTINYTVADMVDSRRNWNWELFAHIIPMQAVMSIAGHMPPVQDTIVDSLVWDNSADGKLTVQSAYMVQEEGGLWKETLYGSLFGSGKEWSVSECFFGL